MSALFGNEPGSRRHDPLTAGVYCKGAEYRAQSGLFTIVHHKPGRETCFSAQFLFLDLMAHDA
ncbi:MAG: hypothetical protein JRF65_02835 [Deltaproteobacteria bacterium]|nr:hypothetical protein [Deltaproteobacteria bacterium]